MAKAKVKKRTKAGTSRASADDRKVAFAEAYLSNNGNGTKAALVAGFSEKSAASQASRLLKDPKVMQLLADRRVEICSNLQISTERVLQERARLAFFDPRKLFDKDGQPIPIQELDDDTAAALAGLDVQEEFSGSGENRVFIGYTKKYKLANKGESLAALEKHLGMYEKDNHQKTDPLADLLGKLSGKVLGVSQ